MFKFDLHVHTFHSGDNDAEPEAMIRAAISCGLDGIVFTEHYYYEASAFADELAARYKDDITVLRGVEFSASEGHCLVYGANTDKLDIKGAAMAELIEAVTRVGGVVIPSHPFRRGSGIGELALSLKGLTALEGCNGCNLDATNQQAIAAASSVGLPCTGGSDAHLPSDVGGCFTVFQSRVTPGNFIDALRAGRYTAQDVRKVSRGWGY